MLIGPSVKSVTGREAKGGLQGVLLRARKDEATTG